MTSRRLIIFGLLLASLAGALVTGRDLFFNLVYLWLTVIIIAALWTWTAINRIRIGRHTRALRAQVGRPLEEVASVSPDVIFELFGKELSMGKGQGLMGMLDHVTSAARRKLRERAGSGAE